MKASFRRFRNLVLFQETCGEAELHICENANDFVRSLNWEAIRAIPNHIVRASILTAHIVPETSSRWVRETFPKCFEGTSGRLIAQDLRIVYETLCLFHNPEDYPEFWMWDACVFLGLRKKIWLDAPCRIPARLRKLLKNRQTPLGMGVQYRERQMIVAMVHFDETGEVEELVLYDTDLVQPKECMV